LESFAGPCKYLEMPNNVSRFSNNVDKQSVIIPINTADFKIGTYGLSSLVRRVDGWVPVSLS